MANNERGENRPSNTDTIIEHTFDRQVVVLNAYELEAAGFVNTRVDDMGFVHVARGRRALTA